MNDMMSNDGGDSCYHDSELDALKNMTIDDLNRHIAIYSENADTRIIASDEEDNAEESCNNKVFVLSCSIGRKSTPESLRHKAKRSKSKTTSLPAVSPSSQSTSPVKTNQILTRHTDDFLYVSGPSSPTKISKQKVKRRVPELPVQKNYSHHSYLSVHIPLAPVKESISPSNSSNLNIITNR